MPILYSRGVIVTDENPNDITDIRTTSDAPIAYNSTNKTYYKFDSSLSVGSRWVAQAGFFTLPTLTAGSVLFSNGTTIAQDNTNFNWSNSLKHFYVGGRGYFEQSSNMYPALEVKHTLNENVSFAINNASTSPILEVNTNSAGDGILNMKLDVGTSKVQINTNGDSYFAGGNFGINNVTPSVALDVTGTVKISSLSGGGSGKFVLSNSSGQLSAAMLSFGTVTSVDMSVPTGLSISGNPITSSGTLAVTYTAGYAIPTTAKQTEWDTAYTDRNKWDGGATGLTASTGRTSLGGTTVGSSFFTLTDPSVITFPRINADNTVSALDAATFRAAIGAGTGSGNGTVTNVTVTTANGVSGSVATSTTTPDITLTLGNITPTTVNGLTISTTTGTLNIGSLKQATFNNTLAFSGTDSTTMTFPTTNAIIARTDAAQTFTGIQTMTSPALTTPTITGTPTGTGVATAATASTLVLRDANVNTKSNNNVDNFTTTATAAGTTTLTVSSSKIQEFTGSTTQTITLPVVTTLTTGHKFEIINNSSGNLTVNSSGSNLVGVIGPGSAAHLTCILITGTSAASWTFSNITNPIFGIPFMFGDGVNVLTVGSKNGIYIPFGYTILEWTLGSVNGTSGSIQLDLWVDSQANFPPTVADTITASAKPLFSSTTKGQSSTLTGWTTTIAPDRWLYVNVDSVTSINQLSGTLKCRKL